MTLMKFFCIFFYSNQAHKYRVDMALLEEINSLHYDFDNRPNKKK